MENNIYQAPQADLDANTHSADHNYYVISKKKFLTLIISTLGIYVIYWFYKNWSLQKAQNNTNTWPVIRGIFSIFFTHSLFRLVNTTLQEKQITYTWNDKMLATTYVVSSVMLSIIDKIPTQSLAPIIDFLSLALFSVSVWALYKAQGAINMACDDPNGDSNSQFTTTNIIFIILLPCILVLFFVAALLNGR